MLYGKTACVARPARRPWPVGHREFSRLTTIWAAPHYCFANPVRVLIDGYYGSLSRRLRVHRSRRNLPYLQRARFEKVPEPTRRIKERSGSKRQCSIQPTRKENPGFHQVGPEQKWFFVFERPCFKAAAEFERNQHDRPAVALRVEPQRSPTEGEVRIVRWHQSIHSPGTSAITSWVGSNCGSASRATICGAVAILLTAVGE